MRPVAACPARCGICCVRPLLILVPLALAAWPGTAGAFWQRSQWAACNEAPTDAERARLNCYVFEPVGDWPIDHALIDRRAQRLPPPPPPPLPPSLTAAPPRWRK